MHPPDYTGMYHQNQSDFSSFYKTKTMSELALKLIKEAKEKRLTLPKIDN